MKGRPETLHCVQRTCEISGLWHGAPSMGLDLAGFIRRCFIAPRVYTCTARKCCVSERPLHRTQVQVSRDGSPPNSVEYITPGR
jgi:hypothetical protein